MAGRRLNLAHVGWAGAAAVGLAIAAGIAGVHLLSWQFILHFRGDKLFGQTLFPAAGVSLAALLFLPRRVWPLILGATFLSELSNDLWVLHNSRVTSLGEATANTLEPLVGALVILAWIGGSPVLTRRRDLAAFLTGGVVIGPAVGALLGVISYGAPLHAFPTGVARWWTGDALGVLVIGGVIIAWVNERDWPVRPRHAVIEIVIGCAGLALVTWAVFWHWQPALAFLTLPFVGWASLRFGARGATTAGLIVLGMAQLATATNHGLFAVIAGSNHGLALWLLQAFVGVIIVMGLVLAAQVAELSRTEHALRTLEVAESEARLEVHEALTLERARLAREIHDAVGHAVSIMVLQAGAARMGMPPDTDSARMVASVEETGRDALTELDRLLGLVEGAEWTSDGAGRERALGLDRLDHLADNVRATGLDVDVHVADSLPMLSPGLDHSAFRIIQEALTNTLKHADATRVDVTVSCPAGDALEIVVSDDGSAGARPARDSRAGGRGLPGMRERVALFGGELRAGPEPSGGWTVEVSLPLGA
jgi:signal transduction histidine kinase